MKTNIFNIVKHLVSSFNPKVVCVAMLMLSLGLHQVWAVAIKDTITLAGFGGITAASYCDTETSGTTNKGVGAKMNHWYGSSGQMKVNQGNTSSLSANNYYVYNTAAMPGNITKIRLITTTGTITANYCQCHTSTSRTLTSNQTYNTSYACTNSGTDHYWTYDESAGIKYFRIGFAKNGGTVKASYVEITYEGDDPGGGCSAGVASGIDAGDVVLIYYDGESNELSGMVAQTGMTPSYYGDVHSYTTTPDGIFPLEVETGYNSTGVSFKYGDMYLGMSEAANNRLVLLDSKTAASSWTVSISSTNATIRNNSFTSYYIRYNTSNDRFSSYTSSAGSTVLPKLYKYCDDVKYYVTYYGNENTGGSVPTDATAYSSGATVTVKTNSGSLTRTGYTFTGWNTKADGSGQHYSATPTLGTFSITANTSLYAEWTPYYRVDVASVDDVTISVSSPISKSEGQNGNVDRGATVTLGMSGLTTNYGFAWDVYKTGESSTKVTVSGSGNGATFTMPDYPVTVSATVTPPYVYFTQCDDDACDDKYCINSYKDGGNGLTCFTDQGSNVWTISNYAIPATGQTDRKDQNDFWVGYDGAWVSGKSADWHFRWIPFKNLACGTYKLGVAAQAVGTLTINAASSNSNTNYDLTFDPNGYGFCYGTDPSWETPLAFTRQGVTNVWNTSIVNVSDVISHNYYVGLSKSGGGYVFSSDYDYNDDNEHIDGISEIQTISGMGVASDVTANPVTFRAGGLSSSDGASGMRGYFQIWTDNCNRNFYCHFVPVYTITYKSYDGSSTLYTDQVSAGESFTVRAAETGAIGWAESASQSAASGNYVVGDSYVPTGNVTLYVAMTAYTVSYTATSGTIQRDAVTISSDVVLSGNSVTLPTVTGCSLPCAKFLGWYAGDYSSASKPAILAAGSSYEPIGDVTLKALYAIVGDNYELVTDEDDLAVGSDVVIALRECDHDFDPNPYFLTAMSEKQKDNNRDIYDYSDSKVSTNSTGDIITWVENTIDVAEFTLEAGVSSGTFSFYAPTVYDKNGVATDAGYLYGAGTATSGKNYLRTRASKTGDGNASWSISISDGVATLQCGNANTPYLRYNTGNPDVFACYNSNSTGSGVSLFQRSVSNYTTSPACTTYSVSLCTPAPSNGTISASPTTVSPNGYTVVTFTPAANYMLDAVTVTSGTADEPAAPVYTSGPTSAGTVRINNISSDITVCATFKAIPRYTVTFVDVDNSNNTVAATQQASYGANVATPSSVAPHTPCDGTWSFVGWCPSNSLSGSTTEPTGFVAAGGTISGALLDDDVTYYSVYTNSSDGTTAFDIGKSGRYYLYALDGATKYYATTWANATKLYDGYDNFATYPKSVLTLTYDSGTGKYKIHNTTIKQSDGSDKSGYFYQSINSSKDITVNEESNYTEFTITTGVADGSYRITYSYWANSVLKTGNFGRGTGFQGYAAGYDVYFEPATSIYYYNASSCTDLVTMTFHPLAGGDPTWAEGHPKGEYTNVPKGTISTFPTDTYSDWTFIGWTAGQSYNDNREGAGETLNDDNGSATAPTQTIYSTGGNSYSLQANVDMYPVFTKFMDNEPFDQINGGDYYIYYIADGDIATSQDAYGANNRMYAGSYGSHSVYSATTSCASATLFTFTKLPNGKWTIYDNDNNDGTIANPKKYLCGDSEGGNDLKLKATATAANRGEWTITVHNGNQFDAVSVDGQTLSASTTTALSGSFKNYDSGNFSNGNESQYHRVYIGSCTERIYSSDPTNTPHIDLKGTIKVTSTATKSVKARTTLTVSASKINTANLTVTSDNSAFKFSLTQNGSYTASVNIPVVSNKVGVTPIYIEYTPAAGSTSDGVEGAIVTVSDGAGTPTSVSTLSGDVQGRHLPENFVIAAKWENNWYALPANCTTSGTWPGILIEVDNVSDPTTATIAMDYTKFGLREVASSRYAANGSNVTFTERLTTSTANNQKTLYNGSTTNIQVYAQWYDYYSSNPQNYEWILSTEDFKDYTLTSADGGGRTVSLNTSGVWGTLSEAKSYDGKVRLLPAAFFEDNVQILEWKQNKVVVMYTGTQTSAKAKVGTYAEASNSDLSKLKLTHGIYELSTGTDMTGKAGTTLLLTFGESASKKLFEIPWIINGSSNATSGHDKHDVVILKNGKLTAQSTKYSFRNIYVYGGGKLKIASGTSLGVNNIILRAGGITTSGMGSSPSASYEYVYPQVELGGTLTSTKTNIQYEYITDYDHWYHLCLPFNASLNSITYPVEYYGRNVTEGNKGSWLIKRYDGAIRSTGEYNAWKDIEKDDPKPTTTTAGIGYIFWGAPKKVSVGGADAVRQAWGIQRMTMSVTADAATTAETNNKDISVDSYSEVATSTKPNDQGWNLVGNPYMVNLTDLSSTSMIAGQLVHTETTPWDGKWRNNGDGVRYVTIPDNHFGDYKAKTASAASGAGDFMPGRAFFVQIAEGASTLTFATSNRASLMPALYATTESVDIETGIVMSDESKQDEVNFWIKDGKTAEYEYNADYPKTPNNSHFNIYGVHSHGDLSWIAISPEIAEGSMAIGYQVPKGGEYMLSMSETYVSDKIEHMFVTDHAMNPEVTVDLMDGSYEFTVNQAETNNERFTISIKLKEDNPGILTGVESLDLDSEQPQKFIWQDKMYILRGGVIYDATGKKVREINK